MTAFHFRGQDLYCEDVSIENLLNCLPQKTHHTHINERSIIAVDVPTTPVYIYSAAAIEANGRVYLDAMKKYSSQGTLGYAAKANGNLELLRLLKSFGVQILITVSGNEILTGLKAGFAAEQIIFNGNGKQDWEIKLAVEQGVLLNVDSIFDARRLVTITSHHGLGNTVKVLLRLRPAPDECDVGVHPYINTSEDSKFGFGLDELDEVDKILTLCENIQIIGLHCHLGSSIRDPSVYTYMGNFLSSATKMLDDKGIEIELYDVGGGICIDYKKQIPGFKNGDVQAHSEDTMHQGGTPGVDEFIKTIVNFLPPNKKLLIEPGRSLVGNAGIIVTKVLGRKKVGNKSYAVVDAAMTELIRPPLYGAAHQILPTKLKYRKEWTSFDVVGPVCESADFLGKGVPLPADSEYLAIMDCGAYGASMGSNYNMRPKPAEILVTGENYKFIRDREQFDDLISKIH